MPRGLRPFFRTGRRRERAYLLGVVIKGYNVLGLRSEFDYFESKYPTGKADKSQLSAYPTADQVLVRSRSLSRWVATNGLLFCRPAGQNFVTESTRCLGHHQKTIHKLWRRCLISAGRVTVLARFSGELRCRPRQRRWRRQPRRWRGRRRRRLRQNTQDIVSKLEQDIVSKLEHLVVSSFWLLKQSVRAPAASSSGQRYRLGSNFKNSLSSELLFLTRALPCSLESYAGNISRFTSGEDGHDILTPPFLKKPGGCLRLFNNATAYL
jgi:hypothetical protein